MKKIPWTQPVIGNEEIQNVLHCFQSNWLSSGPKVRQFEEEIARWLNVPYAVAVSNGTVALDLAMKTLGISPGDEVIVPAMTYMATATAVSYQQAVPVFVDIEPETYNLNPNKIADAISPRTRAMIYIDYGGNPAYASQLRLLSKEHNIHLIHDAAQSFGGIDNGKPVGEESYIATWSFHMAKVITTVEGGMITTHDETVANELRSRVNQGETDKYIHHYLGTNARMTDLNAAIGLAQIQKLNTVLQDRKRVAERYNQNFAGCESIQVMKERDECTVNANFFYPILVDQRDELAHSLKENGVDTRIAFPMPIYQQFLYASQQLPYRKLDCPVAEEFTSQVLNLPIYPFMRDEDIDFVSEKVVQFVESGKKVHCAR